MDKKLTISAKDKKVQFPAAVRKKKPAIVRLNDALYPRMWTINSYLLHPFKAGNNALSDVYTVHFPFVSGQKSRG